ncbi:MAG: SMI1/KNR4 family protein [Ruminococcus sp.]|nr:SMI1/KNR4 family protein [Ruminococcus sp.]
MSLKSIIGNRAIDVSPSPIGEDEFGMVELYLEAKLGDELKEYLVEYGYIGYNFVEMFGVNSKMGARSSMIKKTMYLHENYKQTQGLIAVEDQGDGDYYLVDENDKVYRFLQSREELTDIGCDLYTYISDRLAQAD